MARTSVRRCATQLLPRLAALAALLLALPAAAGVLTQADLRAFFPDAIRIEAKEEALPVWPIVKLDGPTEKVMAYAFESIDLAPIPGFAGSPFNLLIAIDRDGHFIDLRVLSQHEPVFVDGLGVEPLLRFVEQYKGRRLQQPIRIAHGARRAGSDELDGITKATASVRILNESVLAAALQVARARLGFAPAGAAREAARVRDGVFEPLDWPVLVARGDVAHLAASNAEVERLFAGSAVEGADAAALARPDDAASELWLAYLNVPTVGRNLLGEARWRQLMARLEPGQHALLVASAGRLGFIGDDFVRGGVPERLALRQNGLPIELRDLDVDLAVAGAPAFAELAAFRVAAQAGFDPARPWQLALRVERQKGIVWPERVARELVVEQRLPERFFDIPESAETRAWKAVWQNRAADLAALGALFALLAAALFAQRRLVARPQRLAAFRWAVLAATLGFVGWHAQGQLSIVNLSGPLTALVQGRDLGFVLYDPVTLAVAGFTVLTLLVWGRGTFCGWLCPFGALQEFVGKAAQALRVPQWKVPARLDRALGRIKYALLVAILAAAAFAPALADRLVEAEPFKTAITLGFDRAGPALWYALATLALGAFAYKGYCRWICPLGAALAVLARTRRWQWLPRRAECGQPCQRCRHACAYNAIEESGAIRYADCFQCLDCVAIHDDRQRCVPLILMDRHGHPVPLHGRRVRREA
ncbi:4Fe-4S binding protein [Azospira restricta]|uniref:4Fe-4S binding protein n=1 Tax=Azospira restricta TaxID=404405 RepID=A0A974SNJ7_9RHOO|nr:4Fe-4S binding protein [Azospira restricta]QRJ63053.1 4Fe-4S binding protein [Azospira restricta]